MEPEDLRTLAQSLENMLEDSDYASSLLPDLDYESQQMAISELLRRNAVASDMLSKEIAKLGEDAKKAKGEHADYVIGNWVDAMQGSVFHDAASSMAAVGMIAPFVESVFSRAFTTLGQILSRPPEGVADERRAQSGAEYWDCHFFWSRGERRDDLVRGIAQLATSTGLADYLPQDFAKRIDAILTYRNFMFHNGFEWPLIRRKSFARVIEEKQWSDWFSRSERDDDPWIFYLSESFLESWRATLADIIEGIGRFSREKVRPLQNESTLPPAGV